MIEDIEELFVHDKDMPKVCAKCPCYNEEYYCCDVNGLCPDNSYDEKLEICPLESIEEHDKALKERYSKAMKEFAEQCKMAYFYEFEECIPSVMADKIDELLKVYLEMEE